VDAFAGRLAVVTGGATGMGRELVVQLGAAGCSVATCDVDEAALRETERRARAVGATGRITGHLCDVSLRAAVERFRDEVVAEHRADHINLLFNNAGIAGGTSFVAGDPAAWERTFDVCWGGVYNCSRVFMPLLLASDEGYVVNTSSVAGFWAVGAPDYSAAKFAVRGFSEALIADLRGHAPHVKVAVVMPGATGSDILARSFTTTGGDDRLHELRQALVDLGLPVDGLGAEGVRRFARAASDVWREHAPTSPAEAARVILDGVPAGAWRILIGDEARRLDAAVRADPEAAYGEDSPLPALTWAWFVPLILLRALLRDDAVAGLSAIYQLRCAGDDLVLAFAQGVLEVSHGTVADADATLLGTRAVFRELFARATSLDEAVGGGRLTLAGDQRVVEQLLHAIASPGELTTT
jgi:NAD(P)-dependent dehydrogenase (short-subunit alcohol dehydrogenase family)